MGKMKNMKLKLPVIPEIKLNEMTQWKDILSIAEKPLIEERIVVDRHTLRAVWEVSPEWGSFTHPEFTANLETGGGGGSGRGIDRIAIDWINGTDTEMTTKPRRRKARARKTT